MTFKNIPEFLIALALTTFASAQTKISGTAQCGKPDTQQKVDVGDRPNHALVLSQAKCSWTKPLELAGIKDKEGVSSAIDDVRGSNSSGHGYFVDTMENGDKAYVRFQGTAVSHDGATQSAEGKWSYIGGTGKLKGLKGQGTYKGKPNNDGSITYDVDGEYQLPK